MLSKICQGCTHDVLKISQRCTQDMLNIYHYMYKAISQDILNICQR